MSQRAEEKELRKHIESLDGQVNPVNECLVCKADRTQLIEMMHEKPETGLETENHALARVMIANCPSCRDWWSKAHHEPERCPKCSADVSDNWLRDDKGHSVCMDCGTRLNQERP